MEYYPQEEGNIAPCVNMDGSGSITLSETSRMGKDKYCMMSFMRGI